MQNTKQQKIEHTDQMQAIFTNWSVFVGLRACKQQHFCKPSVCSFNRSFEILDFIDMAPFCMYHTWLYHIIFLCVILYLVTLTHYYLLLCNFQFRSMKLSSHRNSDLSCCIVVVACALFCHRHEWQRTKMLDYETESILCWAKHTIVSITTKLRAMSKVEKKSLP